MRINVIFKWLEILKKKVFAKVQKVPEKRYRKSCENSVFDSKKDYKETSSISQKTNYTLKNELQFKIIESDESIEKNESIYHEMGDQDCRKEDNEENLPIEIEEKIEASVFIANQENEQNFGEEKSTGTEKQEKLQVERQANRIEKESEKNEHHAIPVLADNKEYGQSFEEERESIDKVSARMEESEYLEKLEVVENEPVEHGSKTDKIQLIEDFKKVAEESIPILTRKEKEALYEDTTKLMMKGINPNYLKYLNEIPEIDEYSILRNRIIREFLHIKLLCEIEINDNEFKLLCAYFRKKYVQIRKNIEKPIIDITFSVAVVQIGIRYYNGNFWKQVCKVLGITTLPQTQKSWIGGTVTETLLAFGKPIFSPQEYVTNILMHGFVVDSFAYRFFDFLFQYYNIDLQRDISGISEEDLNDLCFSIKNPFGMRKQLLSKYMSMSIRGNEEYCKKIIFQLLNLIDMNFWDEYSSDKQLTGHYLDKFELWKADSSFYKNEKKKMEESTLLENRQKAYRRPHLQCDLDKGIFEIILPHQMIRIKNADDLPEISWLISSVGINREIKCVLEESYSGYRTRETKVVVQGEQIFNTFVFFLYEGSNYIKKFTWRDRKIIFFNENGNHVAGENLEEGAVFAFIKENTVVHSDALIAKTNRIGLEFLEFDLHKGDMIQVPGENNYYIGKVPETGLTKEYICQDVIAFTKDGKAMSIYNKLPACIVDVPSNKFNGTAIILNGKVTKLSQNNFLDIQSGRSEGKKFYFLDLKGLDNIKTGINKIVIDFPNAKRKVIEEFVYIPEFLYSFEDAPYVYQQRGTLKINRKIEKGIITDIICEKDQHYDFDIGDLQTDYISFSVLLGNEYIDINFRVPALFFSWNQIDWFTQKPADIWHTDFKNVVYIKFPRKKISLGVVGHNEIEALFTFNKNHQNSFVCDLTKLKTYFYEERMINSIKLIDQHMEYDLFKIIMKSYIHNVTLEADYEHNYLIWKCDILGKNTYYADVIYNGEVLMEKTCIVDGILKAQLPIHSAKYKIKIYESEDEFGFDDEYDLVGESENSVLSPRELTNSCMKISSIRNIQKTTGDLDFSNAYYIFISGIDNSMEINGKYYIGTLVETFFKEAILRASDVTVFIPDLNKINLVTVTFRNEWNEHELFLYDSYSKCVVEKEDSRFSKSEAYRRYEVLYTDEYYWEVQYVDGNPVIEEKAREWIKKHKECPHDSIRIWKEENAKVISIDEVKLSVRSYNCLKRAGLFTLDQVLISYQKGNLMKIRNLGRKGCEEIYKCLKEHHLI